MLYRFCRAALRFFYSFLFPLRIVGLHHIPKEGPVLLCSNHISNLDPPTVGLKVPRKVHYMAKAELFAFKPIGLFLKSIGAVPVKRGGVSKDAIRLAIQLLKDGHMMGIFPEGTRNSKDAAGKKGAAMIALRSGAVVVPAAIIGPYRLFRTITVVYGPPVDLSEFQQPEADNPLEGATDKIMRTIRQLHESHAGQ